jgi:hypothetical protein
MKKTISIGLLAASLSLYGCQQPSETPTTAETPASVKVDGATSTPEASPEETSTPVAEAGLPLDFTAGQPNVEPGQFVFVPMASSVEKLTSGGAKRVSDIRPREMVKPGPESSVIKDREEFEVPNALIIPTQPDAKVENGDVVLGNPQYSSMEVAIVTDATDPTQPEVHFFKPVFGSDQPEGDKFSGKLEAGKFRVLENQFDPATMVLYPDGDEQGFGQVLNVEGDKVLLTKFGGDLAVFEKAQLTPVPVKPEVKQGDKVQAPFGKGMDPGTVVKVDEKIGRVWVEFDGREGTQSVFSFGQILPAQ